jgi:hypothetical protein
LLLSRFSFSYDSIPNSQKRKGLGKSARTQSDRHVPEYLWLKMEQSMSITGIGEIQAKPETAEVTSTGSVQRLRNIFLTIMPIRWRVLWKFSFTL